jgi:hypothetical protein
LKLWILLSGIANEDLATAVAASGGVAQLSESEVGDVTTTAERHTSSLVIVAPASVT